MSVDLLSVFGRSARRFRKPSIAHIFTHPGIALVLMVSTTFTPPLAFSEETVEPPTEPRASYSGKSVEDDKVIKKKKKSRSEIIREKVSALREELVDCKSVEDGLKKIQKKRDEQYEKYRTIEKTFKTDRKALVTEVKRLKKEEGKKASTKIKALNAQIKTLGSSKLEAYQAYHESYVIYGEVWSMHLNCMMGTTELPSAAKPRAG